MSSASPGHARASPSASRSTAHVTQADPPGAQILCDARELSHREGTSHERERNAQLGTLDAASDRDLLLAVEKRYFSKVGEIRAHGISTRAASAGFCELHGPTTGSLSRGFLVQKSEFSLDCDWAGTSLDRLWSQYSWPAGPCVCVADASRPSALAGIVARAAGCRRVHRPVARRRTRHLPRCRTRTCRRFARQPGSD